MPRRRIKRRKRSRSTTSTAVSRCGLKAWALRPVPCPAQTGAQPHAGASTKQSLGFQSFVIRNVSIHFRQRLTLEGPLCCSSAKSASGHLACSRLLVLRTDTQDKYSVHNNTFVTYILSRSVPKTRLPQCTTHQQGTLVDETQAAGADDLVSVA